MTSIDKWTELKSFIDIYIKAHENADTVNSVSGEHLMKGGISALTYVLDKMEELERKHSQ